jgi:hypothetical protein
MSRIAFFVTVVFLATICARAQTASQVCSDSALPDGVRAVLASEYGSWRIETLADLDKDYRSAWIAKRPSECPGIAAGHFEGNNELSYALLLIPREKGQQAFRLIALSKSSGKSFYSAHMLEQSDTYLTSDAAIFRAEPGLQFNEEKFSTFKLKTDGIYFETFEKAGWIYYWKHGHYVHTVESD